MLSCSWGQHNQRSYGRSGGEELQKLILGCSGKPSFGTTAHAGLTPLSPALVRSGTRLPLTETASKASYLKCTYAEVQLSVAHSPPPTISPVRRGYSAGWATVRSVPVAVMLQPPAFCLLREANSLLRLVTRHRAWEADLQPGNRVSRWASFLPWAKHLPGGGAWVL